MRRGIFHSYSQLPQVLAALALMGTLTNCGPATYGGNDRGDSAAGLISEAEKHTGPSVIEGPPTVTIPLDDWETRYQEAPSETVDVDIIQPPEAKAKIKTKKIKRVRIVRVGRQSFTESPVMGHAPIKNYLPVREISTSSPPSPDSSQEPLVVKPDHSHTAIWVHLFPVFSGDDEYKKTKNFGAVELKAAGDDLIVAQFDNGVALASGKQLTFDLAAKRMLLDGVVAFQLTKPYHIVPGPSTVIQVCTKKCRSYRGTFVVSFEADTRQEGCSNEGGNLQIPHVRVVNVVDIEDYLLGVVPNEIGSGGKDDTKAFFKDSALQAQGIASRTYAAYKMFKNDSKAANASEETPLPKAGCSDVKATTQDQQYSGFDDETLRATKAIQSTRGVLIKFNNEVIQANYHGNSGGQTRSVTDWTGKSEKDFPYLVPVKELDVSAVRKGIGGVRQKPVLQQALVSAVRASNAKFPDSSVVRVEIKERNTSGGVTAMQVVGPTTSVTLQGKTLSGVYSRIGLSKRGEYKWDYFGFKGKDEDVASIPVGGAIPFEVYGNGHRVGMSQVGAGVLSQYGKKASEILRHYYGPSVEVSR